MDDEGHDSWRYKQRTLHRWRLSLVLSFAAGCLITMVAYPQVKPCAKAEVIAELAASKCPSCPSCPSCTTGMETKRLMSDAIGGAMSLCPKCAGCPGCPDCKLECPKITPGPGCPQCAEPDSPGVVAAAFRATMLARPMKGSNIIECKPGQECRMSPANRHKIIGQKGVTMWMTGLSGSGKTTISESLEKKLLLNLGKNVYRIDGDNLRTVRAPNPNPNPNP
jgi:hypothetical protein